MYRKLLVHILLILILSPVVVLAEEVHASEKEASSTYRFGFGVEESRTVTVVPQLQPQESQSVRHDMIKQSVAKVLFDELAHTAVQVAEILEDFSLTSLFQPTVALADTAPSGLQSVTERVQRIRVTEHGIVKNPESACFELVCKRDRSETAAHKLLGKDLSRSCRF